jgi:hypothetical protein
MHPWFTQQLVTDRRERLAAQHGPTAPRPTRTRVAIGRRLVRVGLRLADAQVAGQ